MQNLHVQKNGCSELLCKKKQKQTSTLAILQMQDVLQFFFFARMSLIKDKNNFDVEIFLQNTFLEHALFSM